MSQFVLLTIGKTHTGKTTFGKELLPQIPNGVILETDPIALFLREAQPQLHSLDLDHSGGFSSPSLKFLLFRTMLTFALEQKFNIIMSNSNMYEKGRQDVLGIIKKYPVKTIGVYFNFPEELLTERVKTSERDTNVLRVSKNFENLIVNQRTRFQPPLSTDFDYFYEVTDPNQVPDVAAKIIELYRK